MAPNLIMPTGGVAQPPGSAPIAPVAGGAVPNAAAGSAGGAAGASPAQAQSTRRIQVADILNLLHRAVNSEKWAKISAVVNQIKESTKASGVNDTDSKRKLLQSIRDIAGIDLWNKVVMVLHQQGSNPRADGSGQQQLTPEQMQRMTAEAAAKGMAVDQYIAMRKQQSRQAQAQRAQQMKQEGGKGGKGGGAKGGKGAAAPAANGAALGGSAGGSGGRPQPTVGQVINAVKRFVKQEDHKQLEALQEQYLSRVIDKKQLEQRLRSVAGDHALRQAIASLFPKGSGPTAPQRDNSTEAKALVAHAYKCRDNQCQYGKKCFDTKLKLQQLARHAQTCQQNAGTNPNQTSQCRLCRMWKYVQQMRYAGGGPGGGPVPPGASPSQGGGAVRIREADPAVLRRLALEHMSKCNGCEKCNRLREKMRAQQNLKHGGRAGGRQPPAKRRKTVGAGGAKAAGGRNTAFVEVARDHREISRRNAPDVLEEGERIEVLTAGSEKSATGPHYKTAKILECDHEKQQMTIQYSGTIGNAFAIAGYDKIPMTSPGLKEFTDMGKDAPIPVDEGRFFPGCFVETFTRNRTGNGGTWSSGEVQALSADGRYTVELESGASNYFMRDEMRAVCNHPHCRKRTLVFELPQLYCVKCKVALRIPGSCYYQEMDDSAQLRGGGRGVQLCHLCFCEVRAKGKQKGANALWRTIGREMEFDFEAFSEVSRIIL